MRSAPLPGKLGNRCRKPTTRRIVLAAVLLSPAVLAVGGRRLTPRADAIPRAYPLVHVGPSLRVTARYAVGAGAMTVTCSTDGKHMAIRAMRMPDSRIGVYLLPATPGGKPQLLKGQRTSARAIAMSPDGALLATADFDGVTRLWSTRTRALVREMGHYRRAVGSVAWRPDGRQLASGSFEGAIWVWDATTGEQMASFLSGDNAGQLAWSADGKSLFAGGQAHAADQWDVRTGYRLRAFPDVDALNACMAVSPDGKTLAMIGMRRYWDPPQPERWEAHLFTVETGRELPALAGLGPDPRCLAFSPDGAWLAVGDGERLALYDAAGWARAGESAEARARIVWVCFTADPHVLVSLDSSGTVCVWRVGP